MVQGSLSQSPLTWEKTWDHADVKDIQQINFLKQKPRDSCGLTVALWSPQAGEPLCPVLVRLPCHTPSEGN